MVDKCTEYIPKVYVTSLGFPCKGQGLFTLNKKVFLIYRNISLILTAVQLIDSQSNENVYEVN